MPDRAGVCSSSGRGCDVSVRRTGLNWALILAIQPVEDGTAPLRPPQWPRAEVDARRLGGTLGLALSWSVSG